jgi:hypothetical protein
MLEIAAIPVVTMTSLTAESVKGRFLLLIKVTPGKQIPGEYEMKNNWDSSLPQPTTFGIAGHSDDIADCHCDRINVTKPPQKLS